EAVRLWHGGGAGERTAYALLARGSGESQRRHCNPGNWEPTGLPPAFPPGCTGDGLRIFWTRNRHLSGMGGPSNEVPASRRAPCSGPKWRGRGDRANDPSSVNVTTGPQGNIRTSTETVYGKRGDLPDRRRP